MNREIGGYLELDTYRGKMLHDDGILVNSARHALEYLIIAKGIKKLAMPIMMCDSCDSILKKHDVCVRLYKIDMSFHIDESFALEEDEWLYIVNHYGQYDRDYIDSLGDRVIVDNVQAYYEEPIENRDTIYSCRKFFGLPDGGILYTDTLLKEELKIDESASRMTHLLGRYEGKASDYYSIYADNNKFIGEQELMSMSLLTRNLLHGIDYEFVKARREENFRYLYDKLEKSNKLNLKIPVGPFMYPLYIDNGGEIKKKLLEQKIYVPTFWPSVLDKSEEGSLEYDMANNVIALPIDQRYTIDDMEYMVDKILKMM